MMVLSKAGHSTGLVGKNWIPAFAGMTFHTSPNVSFSSFPQKQVSKKDASISVRDYTLYTKINQRGQREK